MQLNLLVDAVWLTLVTLILLSPYIPLLTHAGTYGKLLVNSSDRTHKKKNEHEADSNKVAASAAAAGSARASFSPPSTPSSSPSSSPSLLFHPLLFVRTRVAFQSYYFFATFWNGWILMEVVLARHMIQDSLDQRYTGPVIILPLLRSLDEFLRLQTIPLSSSLWSLDFHADRTGSTAATEPTTQLEISLLLIQLVLFQVHLLRRMLESFCVTNFSPSSEQHGMITIMGLVYYGLAVITPVVDSHIVGGRSSGIIRLLPSAPLLWLLLGSVLFVVGWVGQLHSHLILARLRSGRNSKKNDDDADPSTAPSSSTRYVIPTGGLFHYVSMPHYLCEMILYTGLFFISGGKLSQALICAWVYSNLSITAARSHKWYLQRFQQYPKNRKAVIPFVW